MSMKNCVTLSLTVHEEEGVWLDWWLECDDPDVVLPEKDEECVPILEKYDVIFVEDKWFPGEKAKEAIEEVYRVTAEMYDEEEEEYEYDV